VVKVKSFRPKLGILSVWGVLIVSVSFYVAEAQAAMNDYCITPPFISAAVPPLVMFEMGREHKLYYEAYNDSVDLNEDGRIDTEYNHSIEYYGYFDANKCYVHSGGSGSNDKFSPVGAASNKFCSSSGGQLSGNFLNWLTMSRMDVLKKVLYGGERSDDSNTSTVLKRVYIPQDAHSWGKEATGRLCYNLGTVTASNPAYTNMCMTSEDCESGYSCSNKSNELIGIGPSDAPSVCPSSVTVGSTNNVILVARYNHSSSLSSDIENGVTHSDLLNSYDPLSLFSYSHVSDFNNAILNPGTDHYDHYNIFAVADFEVENSGANAKGTWQFLVDGDDGTEVEIWPAGATSGTVVASYYGGHAACFLPSATVNPNTKTDYLTSCPGLLPGSINLPNGWARIVVRQTEGIGQDGVRVWVKRKNDSTWQLFGSATFGSGHLKAPTITATNECSIKATTFIETGKPVTGATTGKRHLYCNTTLSDGGTPILRFLQNKTNRIWEWASKERPVCDTSLGTPADFTVQVQVCDNSIGLETNCKEYAGTYKPVGLLQKYGESVGAGKVCSKTMSKTCNSNADCSFSTEGQCVDKATMYFGLMTDSYTKNLSGGVLRKNIGSILDETNANNGIFQTSENEQGNIIITLDRLKTIGFDYGSHSYTGVSGETCGWISTRPLKEGECRMWGNPIAEMMYESLRYFAGKGGATAEFEYSGTQDSGLNLSKPAWGYKDGSIYHQAKDIFPSCARPFILLLSDINTSYDSDQVPGSSFEKTDGTFFSEDAAAPQLKLGVVTSGASLLNTLSDFIGTKEGVIGNSWFIGENGSVTDFICSSKSASKMSLLRGTCPEEPTKLGSFHSAAVAYYGNMYMKANANTANVTSFVVALSSPVADFKVKVGDKLVTLVPAGKSVSGSHSIFENCAQKCTFTRDDDGLHISNCSSTSFCPSNQIVDSYIDDIRYDSSKNVIYAKFRINYEDVEQGADHDMDAIVTYEVCTQAAIDAGHGSCTGTLGSDKLQLKLSSEYAAGSIDQVLGFVISGTTEDGIFLPVKDKDIGGLCYDSSGTAYSPGKTCKTDSDCSNNLGSDYCGHDGDSPDNVTRLPLNWDKTFTVSGAAAISGFLKSPLWYTAKWGGFIDKNNNHWPDLAAEWDTNGDGTPDNYFLVVNPLKLEQQLDKALSEILARVSSGTAASILNNSEGSGANLLQAVFYPKKDFDGSTSATWIGEMQNLWYYLDPFLEKTSIREDTTNTSSYPELNLNLDKIVKFYFDTGQNKTLVQTFSDSNGDGSVDSSIPDTTVDPDYVMSLWKAGELLHARDLSTNPRTIYAHTTGTGFTTFNTDAANIAKLKPYLDVGNNDALAATVIRYTTGYDDLDDSTLRPRTVSFKGVGGDPTDATVKSNAKNKGIGVWKLGDIISSTPKLLSNIRLNSYSLAPPLGYNDTSYKKFLATSTYKDRGMAFVGANDGMLHAFKLGTLEEITNKYIKSKITGTNLGQEMWSFIPKSALPYLKYLSAVNPDYCHLYFVDNTTLLTDVSINKSTSCGASNYWECEREYGTGDLSWRTILIGGMGQGGASKNTIDSYCVKTPLQVTESGVAKDIGYSSYYALDVTDPTSPSFKWEFAGDPASGNYLGFSTTGPAVVRVGGKNLNGRWLAVFASGPTGPIDTTLKEFQGKSNQELKLFIVDMADGALLRTINTGLANAFAGSLASGVIDTDRWNPNSTGFYNDDAVYIGYVQKDGTSGTWTKGGVIRLLTQESTDPGTWTWSPVITNVGPVTTSVTKLQDRKNKNLWLFFGTGRYFYKMDDGSTGTRQRLYGIKEPCYSMNTGSPSFIPTGPVNDIQNSCTSTISSGLTDQTADSSAPQTTLPASSNGWYIEMDSAAGAFLSERVITDPIASPNGAVFFTSFFPTADICGMGGNSYIWSVRYDTGAEPPAAALKGVALMQVSTGSFAEIKLSDAFTAKYNRRTGTPITGVPPKSQGLSLLAPPRPAKKMLQIQEK
jgi:type IV pilus assembly protein PilY1